MRRNFSVISEIAVTKDGKVYDLHNDFDFDMLCINARERSMSLSWNARQAAAESGGVLRFDFQEIQILYLKGNDADAPREDDMRLAFLGYLHPDDREVMDGYLPEDRSTDDYHMILCFEGGLAVKVFSAEANFQVG